MSGGAGNEAEPLRIRRPLLHPSRWPVVAGLVLVVPGVFGPWQQIVYPVGPSEIITGTSGGDAPGVQVLLFAVATALACGSTGVAGSRTRTVQFLPLLGGLTTLIVAIRSFLALGLSAQGSGITIEWGMWAVLAGSGLIALGGLATTVVVRHDRPLQPEPWEPRADLSFVPTAIAAVVGIVVALVGVELTLPLLPSSYQLAAVPLFLVGTFVAALGAYVAIGWLWGPRPRSRGRGTRPARHDMPELEPLEKRSLR